MYSFFLNTVYKSWNVETCIPYL